MIFTLMIIVFIIGYAAIALEHPIKVDKAASALIIGGLGWALFAFSGVDHHTLTHEIQHHIVDIAEILFFLLAAMTIVEVVDAHQGFAIITDKITTNKKVYLIWILSVITFFFSAVLDNLTTAIVMAALLPKLIKDKETLWLFAGVLIIVANAGGAWSPIGDVTTIMLWIGGQVSAVNIISAVIIPSIVCAIVPLIYLTFKLKGNIERPNSQEFNKEKKNSNTSFERNLIAFGENYFILKIVGVSLFIYLFIHIKRNLIFYLGVGGLLFVPVFKTFTHLPPYVGMMLSLGFLWLVTEIIHRNKNHEEKSKLSVIGVLKKVDTPTIFFFLGILLAVAALQSAGHLDIVAIYLDTTFNGQTTEGIYIINIIIGLLSSIVDNVPLVAGAMGMYPIAETGLYAMDGKFWEFLAYCAGTGGSVLIIGSAAGVAVMGILKIDFIWYVKNISFLALIGYVSGAITYILLQ